MTLSEFISDFTGLLLCSLRRHRWHLIHTDHRSTPPLLTEVCARRGCRGRTQRQRVAS